MGNQMVTRTITSFNEKAGMSQVGLGVVVAEPISL
jgi:hypothetical protein